MAMSTEGAAVGNVEGPNLLAPLMNIGGMVWAENPSAGLFIICAMVGLAGAYVLKRRRI